MGAGQSSSTCKDGECLTADKTGTGTGTGKGVHYRAKWLKKKWSGTAREGYRYTVGYAPTGAATCRACGDKIAKGGVRIGRSTPNPFDAEGGASDYTQYFHADHAFDAIMRSKCTSRVPLTASDIAGVADLKPADRKRVQTKLVTFARAWGDKCAAAKKKA